MCILRSEMRALVSVRNVYTLKGTWGDLVRLYIVASVHIGTCGDLELYFV